MSTSAPSPSLARPPTRGRRVLAWLPPVAWAGAIFLASAQSDLRFVPDDATLDFIVRKIGHAGVFGVLALLSWRALGLTTRWRRPWAGALLLAAGYALADEFHQAFVAGRHASLVDVGIDTSGALVGVAVVLVIAARRRGGSRA